MHLIPFDPKRVRDGEGIFGAPIDTDPWVAFHGTSSVFEQTIDANGLQTCASAFSRAEVESVVQIYDALDWCGNHGGGYAVLQPFSLNFDRASTSLPPIYLAESSHRALTYAAKDFAGGETARALRYALMDLEAYDGALPAPTWLQEKLEALANLKARVFEPLLQHSHGVVYAVRFEPNNFESISYGGTMGLKSMSIIHPVQVIAKTVIPADYEPPGCEDKRRLARKFEEGLVKAVRDRFNLNQKK